eukprot:353546-Chlamydomonas_euryale.AAC.3
MRSGYERLCACTCAASCSQLCQSPGAVPAFAAERYIGGPAAGRRQHAPRRSRLPGRPLLTFPLACMRGCSTGFAPWQMQPAQKA